MCIMSIYLLRILNSNNITKTLVGEKEGGKKSKISHTCLLKGKKG